MSFKILACALAEALIEDIHPFTPFSMAVMSEYGKVGGYAPAYLEVKQDVEEFLAFCQALNLRSAALAPELPPLIQDRLIREEFFLGEQRSLTEALQRAASALRAEGEGQLEERARSLDLSMRRLFDKLLHRSGIDPKEALRLHPTHGEGVRIYVASRHSVRLRDQICGYLEDAGLSPIMANESGGAGVDGEKAKRVMANCSGGVFGLTSPKPGMGGAIPLDNRLASAIAEIMLAETTMGRRLMILAQERAAARLPDSLRDKPIFTMRDQEMDDVELSLFKTVASRTPWLTN